MVDDYASALGGIHHIERQNHGAFQSGDLQNKAEMKTKIGGIGDANNEVRGGFTRAMSETHIPCNGFVRPHGIQTIGAGKIHDLNCSAGRGDKMPLLAFNRHPCIVGDLLLGAGQLIEQGRFAAIGVADKSNGERVQDLSWPV